jgi:hypothetical protein
MGVSGRPSLLSSIVAALCIVVYIAVIAFGAVQIILNIRERQNRAKQEFDDLVDRTSSSAVFLGFMTEAHKETIRDFLESSGTPLLGVIITGPNAEYAFERGSGSGIVWSGNSPRLKTGAGYPVPLYKHLPVEGQRNVNVMAIYSYIDYNYFLGVLRTTLLAVLGTLAAALITLMFELLFGNRHPRVVTEDKKPEPVRKREVEIIRRPDFGSVTRKTEEPLSEKFPDFNDDSLSITEEEEEEEPDIPEPEHPRGLYTERNIGWESYTHDRLASELHRCASFEQDLTFLAMEFPDKNDDDLYRKFADEAVSFFSMRDLIFEKGDNGIYVILNTSLEQGIGKSEEFRNRLNARLPKSFEGRNDLRIGLSSRSGRLINAERIMLEANTALEKALAETASPIIAFKSDPEKYREFIKNRLKE